MFEARRPAEWWREHLDGVIGRPQDFKGICPAHPDEAPSLHVTGRVGKDALVKCFAGCKYEAIVAAIEATPVQRDVVVSFRPRLNGHAPAIRYEIRDVAGILRATHVRTDLANGSKSMTWEGGLNGLRAEDLPLYGSQLLPAWPTDEIIVVTEGEKAAQALLDAGFHALGTVTGAQATPSLVALGPLLGRPITFWPDADDVGLLHMSRLADELKAHGSKPRTVEPPEGVAKGWDAADAVEVLTPTQVEELIRQAPPSESMPAGDDDALISAYLDDVDEEEPQPLRFGLLHPSGHTVLFGDGGTGKSIISAWLIARLVAESERVLLLDYEMNARFEWKPRIRKFGGLRRQVKMLQPGPKPKPIWDTLPRILYEIEEFQATWIFVDSVGYACIGHDAADSVVALQYQAAVAQFGLPVISLAHTTKTGAEDKYPFGSIFWHNSPRLTIGVTRGDGVRVLTNHKANDRGEFMPIALDWKWSEANALPDRLEEVSLTPRMVPGTAKAADTLLDFVPDDWPGISRDGLVETLEANGIKMSYSTVMRTLKALEEAGIVISRKEEKGSLMYRRRVEE